MMYIYSCLATVQCPTDVRCKMCQTNIIIIIVIILVTHNMYIAYMTLYYVNHFAMLYITLIVLQNRVTSCLLCPYYLYLNHNDSVKLTKSWCDITLRTKLTCLFCETVTFKPKKRQREKCKDRKASRGNRTTPIILYLYTLTRGQLL